jgi:hypothetical protein
MGIHDVARRWLHTGAASVSHVAVLPDLERAAVLDEVRHLLATNPGTAGHDALAIPSRVDAYWCERLR